MSYHASEPKFLWMLLLIITLIYASVLDGVWVYLAYVLSFLFFFAMLVTYHVEFTSDGFVYQKKFLGLTITKREIKPDEIQEITMVKAGRTIHLIHFKKGVRLKLHRFSDAFDKQLESFAKDHQISVHKPSKNAS